MKYRNDFVTNSSSSSYVCDVCGREESGMDMSLSEAEMFRCVNDHTFCEHHIDGDTESIEWKKALLKELITEEIESIKERTYYTEEQKTESINDYKNDLTKLNSEDINNEDIDDMLDGFDYRYDCPSKLCPVCSFKVGYAPDLLKFLLKIGDATEQGLLEKLKEEYGTYDAFLEYLNGK